MKKQEVIDEIENAIPDFVLNSYEKGKESGLSYALELVNQLDEPVKPVVPRFIAEWIKTYKEKGGRLSYALEHVFDDVELSLYIKQQECDYTETIAKAWLAYPNITVEQEKLYTIELPDPNSFDAYIHLSRNIIGMCFEVSNDAEWKQKKINQFTEAEIRKDFEWAWQFAKEVEDD